MGLIATILTTYGIIQFDTTTTPPSAKKFSSGSFQYLDSPTVSQINSFKFEPKLLPDEWIKKNQDHQFSVYSFIFELADLKEDLYGIYIPKFKTNIELYINDNLIGNTGQFYPKITVNWRSPAYFSFNKNQLKIGKNNIKIILGSAFVDRGYLSDFYFGEHNKLNQVYRSHYHKNVTLVAIECGILTFISILTMLLYLLEGKVLFKYFSICCLLWGMFNGLSLITYNWFDFPLLIPSLMMISMIWFCNYLLKVNHSLLRLKRPLLERVYSIVISIFTLLVTLNMLKIVQIHSINTMINAIIVSVLMLYGIYTQLKFYRSTNILDYFGLYFSLLIIITLGIHDLLVSGEILTSRTYSLHYAAFVYVFIILRFIIASHMREKLKVHSKLFLSKIGSAKIEERRRIKSDLHDSVAGQITALLSSVRLKQVEQSNIEYQLEMILSELRAIIRNEPLTRTNFFELIDQLKVQITPILTSLGMRLDWNVTLLEEIELSKETALHLSRILQEAITNIIKHSKASRVIVSAVQKNNKIEITIQDNGQGFKNINHSGYGIGNMQQRMVISGGNFDIFSSNNGTTLTFSIPILHSRTMSSI